MKLIKIEQPSCVPCKMVGNYLNDKSVDYEVYDVFDRPDIAQQFGVMSTPTIILLDDDDNEVERVVGYNPSALDRLIAKL